MNDVQKLSQLFKNREGLPQILKPGQLEIFETIVTRGRNVKKNRASILCYTRYGKSMTIAEAVLTRATRFPEPWIFVGPSKDQAEQLMNHLVQHLFDSKRFYSQLQIDIPLERLKRERRKDRLTFRRGGEVNVLTADARNTRRLGALLGRGGQNVILDEAPLIPDKLEAMVIRMLANSADNFFVKVGNAFENNHFKKSFQNSKYHNIIVNCYEGLKQSELLPYDEGRLTQEIIDEMRDKPFFEQLWECRFPDISLMDERGFTAILTEQNILSAFSRVIKEVLGRPRLGVDIGRGGDYSTFVLRYDNYAKLLEKNKDPNLMSQVGKIKKYQEEYKINQVDIFVDDIGVGGGVTDKLKEDGIMVTAVVAGGSPKDSSRYKNVRAEAYWESRNWILNPNNKLEKEDGFHQFEEIRYKEDSSRKLFIEPKIEYRQREDISPDISDGLMLTFAPQVTMPDVMFI